MNNAEKIQALKDNKEAFGLMSEEMQAKAKEIGRDRFQCRWYNKWVNASRDCLTFDSDFTYRLNPDYTEEPEVRRVEIAPNNSKCLCMYNDKGQTCGSIVETYKRPDCIGIEADGWLYGRLYINKVSDAVATVIWAKELDEWEVLTPEHALFRKEKK